MLLTSGLVIGALHLAYSNRTDFNIDRKILIEKRSIQFIHFGLIVWWFFFFLSMIDLKTSFLEWVNEFLMVNYNVGTLNFTLNEVLTFLIVLTVSFLISNTISMIVDGGALNFLKLPKGIPAAISMVLRYIVIAFGFILALSVLGVDLSQFNLMAGALGLGIGFGLQTIISNFVSGLILVFERPILPGDTVEVQNLLGNVTNIGVRSSKVRTFDGAEVIVPNNNLISNDLINWTLSDNVRRIEIKIGTAYGSDPNIVLKILIEEALKNEFTMTNPEPVALFDQFGDSSLDFRLLVWVPYDKGLISKSTISVGIYNSFKENNIEIPFPQRDIHIKDQAKKKEGSDQKK
jgi:small-conductance mechanosensitive channel